MFSPAIEIYYDSIQSSQKPSLVAEIRNRPKSGWAVYRITVNGRGNEIVALRSTGSADMSQEGWRLRDRSGNEHQLSGILAAGTTLQITMTNSSMTVNNDGDSVELNDSNGNVVH